MKTVCLREAFRWRHRRLLDFVAVRCDHPSAHEMLTASVLLLGPAVLGLLLSPPAAPPPLVLSESRDFLVAYYVFSNSELERIFC